MRFPSVTMLRLCTLSWVSCLVATIRGCGNGLCHQKAPRSKTVVNAAIPQIHRGTGKVRALATPDTARTGGIAPLSQDPDGFREPATDLVPRDRFPAAPRVCLAICPLGTPAA